MLAFMPGRTFSRMKKTIIFVITTIVTITTLVLTATETLATSVAPARVEFLENLGLGKVSPYGDISGLDTLLEEESEQLGDSTSPGIKELLWRVKSLKDIANDLYGRHAVSIETLLVVIKSARGKKKKKERTSFLTPHTDSEADEDNLWTAAKACRSHIYGIFSPGGHAYYCRVHSFIAHGAKDPVNSPYAALAKVYHVAKSVQNVYLDEEVSNHLATEHKSNKKVEQSGESVAAVAFGGGPTGYWATLHAFKAGFNTLTVDRHRRDRLDYKRARAVRIDPIFTEQLRWFLGTLFDDHVGEWASIIYEGDEEGGCIYIDIYHLEILLRERLEALADHIRNKRPDVVEAGAELKFEDEWEVANVRPPNQRISSHSFEVVLHKWAAREARKRGEKPIDSRQYRVEVVLNCGGASRNPMRHLYTGVPEPHTWPKSYFVVVADRGERAKQVSFTQRRFHVNESAEQLPKLSEFLFYCDPDELNAIVARHTNSCPARISVSQLGDALKAEVAQFPTRRFALTSVFNKHDGLHLAGMPPLAIAAFNRELKVEIKKLSSLANGDDVAAACSGLLEKVNNYFFAAAMRMVAQLARDRGININVDAMAMDFINVDVFGEFIPGTRDDFALSLNPKCKLNRQIFELEQNMPSRPADYSHKEGKTLIFNVYGDAAAEPNFFAERGLVTARAAVEEGVGGVLAQDYPNGRNGQYLTEADAKSIVSKQQQQVYAPIQAAALGWGKKYSRPMIQTDQVLRERITMERACDFINELSRQGNQQQSNYDFAIICDNLSKSKCVEVDRPEFNLQLANGDEVRARVEKKGGLFGLRAMSSDSGSGGGNLTWEQYHTIGKAALDVSGRPLDSRHPHTLTAIPVH